MSEDRLTELEIKASLTEDMLEELNLTVFRQQQEIRRLQEQLRLIYQKMNASEEMSFESGNPRDEIPPHY